MVMFVTSSIDASCFPHIVDLILSHLCDDDPLTAASLQTVCRLWHSEIKLRLFTHLWIACGPVAVTSSDVASSTPVATVASDESFSVGTLPVGQAPSLRFTAPLSHTLQVLDWLESVKRHPLVVAAVRSARVIDADTNAPLFLPSEGFKVPILRVVSSADTDTNMLIMNDTDTPPPTAEMLVIFTYTHNFLSSVLSGSLLANKIVIHAPESDPAPFDFWLSIVQNLPATIENVTVFYPHQRLDGHSAYNALHNPPKFEYTLKFFVHTEFLLRTWGDQCMFTFVLPDWGDRSRHSSSHSSSLEVLRTTVQLYAPVPDRLKYHTATNQLTATEYHDRVGEEAYRLHTYLDMSWRPSCEGEARRPPGVIAFASRVT